MAFEDIVQAIGKKPYFQDDAAVIYCADNREILPLIPDKSVDLVLTDPPYGLNLLMQGGTWGIKGIMIEVSEKYCQVAVERLRQGVLL